MAIVYLTRRFHFSSSHRLHSDMLDERTNIAIFGQCNNFYGHGHNYELEVTIKGTPDPATGMIINLYDLKKIVNEKLISRVDHKHLNEDVDFMQGIVPTAENLVVEFWEILKDALPAGELYELKLYETPNNVALYRGEQQ